MRSPTSTGSARDLGCESDEDSHQSSTSPTRFPRSTRQLPIHLPCPPRALGRVKKKEEEESDASSNNNNNGVSSGSGCGGCTCTNNNNSSSTYYSGSGSSNHTASSVVSSSSFEEAASADGDGLVTPEGYTNTLTTNRHGQPPPRIPRAWCLDLGREIGSRPKDAPARVFFAMDGQGLSCVAKVFANRSHATAELAVLRELARLRQLQQGQPHQYQALQDPEQSGGSLLLPTEVFEADEQEAEAETVTGTAEKAAAVLALVMPVFGRSLADLMMTPQGDSGTGRAFSHQELVGIAEQLLQAVHYLHQNGIAHLDIKPHNILARTPLSCSPYHHPIEIRLIDFGSAAIGVVNAECGADGAVSVSVRFVAQVIHSTVRYAAPEVCSASGMWAGPSLAMDVWMVGATLMHLLTGRMPYAAEAAEVNDLWRLAGMIHNREVRLEDEIPSLGRPLWVPLLRACLQHRHSAAELLGLVPSADADGNTVASLENTRSAADAVAAQVLMMRVDWVGGNLGLMPASLPLNNSKFQFQFKHSMLDDEDGCEPCLPLSLRASDEAFQDRGGVVDDGFS
eukprot:TRINITY_DN3580_c0_g1_i1.p1 TRINITY_DN3580_c0_g1~~TRINITY_DN3580_c0_g1_i1.p1  ORF type:complete len:586 (+),score=100.32 TRINITY_DN3580_c0_g1_i1:60-1760(+)